MYENLSKRIKSYVKILTIITMALVLVIGVIAAILLIRAGNDLSLIFGIGALLLAAITAFVLYFLSFFAYGFGELLEQQTVQLSVDRQILNALRDQTAAPAPEVKTAPAQTPPTPVSAPYPAAYPTYRPAAPSMTDTQPLPHLSKHYPAYPPRQQPPEQPYGAPRPSYPTYDPQNYRTQTPYGTATGFNEEFRYEPKR